MMHSNKIKKVQREVDELIGDNALTLADALCLSINLLESVSDATIGFDKDLLRPLEALPEESIQNAIDNIRRAIVVLRREGL